MKKLLIIGVAIIAFFVLIVVLSNKSDEAKLKNNPYETEDLAKSTINLIGNEHYDNIIMPNALVEKIQSGDSVNAYFFHPECQYCQAMTPILMPIAKELDVPVYQFNMLEFHDQAAPFGIESWPIVVHYKDGKEVGRMKGLQTKEGIRAFFNEFEGK